MSKTGVLLLRCEACGRTMQAYRRANPEKIRRAYNRLGARFAVDAEGKLAPRLELDLGEVGQSLQEERTSSGAATG